MKFISSLVMALAAMQLQASEITPVQQVLNMLAEMKVKGEKEMEMEQKTYAEYAEWVDDRSKELGFEIKTATSNIEQLQGFIAKTENDIAQLGKNIAALDAEIDRLETDKAAAEKVRADQHEEFLKVQLDYSESVDALERAIQVMKSQEYDRPQAEALLQKMAVNSPAMRRVMALLQMEKRAPTGAPEVAGYEFQSSSIIAVLEGLLEKFKGELSDVETEESNQAHNFDLEMITMSDSIKKFKADRAERAAMKAYKSVASAKAQGDLATTQDDLAADQKLKAEIEATFKAKSSTFEANQKIRKDELTAIKKAIEIISSPAVADSYSTHINLVQNDPHQSPAFVQLRLRGGASLMRLQQAVQQKAAAFLSSRAKDLSSKVLRETAHQLAAGPFDKVIDMIKALLARLKEEAAAEAEHKAWCDQQLKDNKIKRDKKTAQVEKLAAEVEALAAAIAKMAEEIAVLAQEQEDLTKAMTKATEVRTKEKAENEATMADSEAGIQAIKKALVILHEFYDSQTAFVQQVPEMAEYKGMHGSKHGVIGMLEVIETDFSRLLADTKSAETAAAAEYDTFMTESKASKLAKHNAEFKLKLEKDQSEFEKSQVEKDLALVSTELEKANAYYEELKPACLQVHVSYEERVARRKEEIEALKEAYKILDSKTVS